MTVFYLAVTQTSSESLPNRVYLSIAIIPYLVLYHYTYLKPVLSSFPRTKASKQYFFFKETPPPPGRNNGRN